MNEHKKMGRGNLTLIAVILLVALAVPAWAFQKVFLDDHGLSTASGNHLRVNTSNQWQFTGSFTGGYVKVGAANYGSLATPIPQTAFNGIAGINSSAAVRYIYAPDAAVVSGQELRVQDEGGAASTHNITIVAHGAQTINGAGTYVISTNYGGARVYSDGTHLFAK